MRRHHISNDQENKRFSLILTATYFLVNADSYKELRAEVQNFLNKLHWSIPWMNIYIAGETCTKYLHVLHHDLVISSI